MKGLVKPGFFFIFYLPSCISALCYKAYLVSIWYRHPTINRRRSVSVQTCLPNIVCKLQWVCFLQSISFDCWSSKHNVIIAVRWKIQDKKIRFPKRRHFVQEYPRRLKLCPVNRVRLESKLPRDFFYSSELIYRIYLETDGDFSGTVILQLWLLYLYHFVISPFRILNTPGRLLFIGIYP